MNEKEFLKVCSFNPEKLKRYKQAGILDKQNFNEDDICLISTLENIGFSLETIKIYLDNYHTCHIDTCLNILKRQRNIILNDIHGIQKNVDMIDMLMKQFKEEY
ncbi:MAG: hypothetical protein LUG12_12220 [Erysipelotrichaceae bacterium]|nr:hypothetical protein [Erysipelotrichaceae bacterium]